MIYAMPGQPGAKHTFKPRYDNFIGGQWVAPVKGAYFDVVTPISGANYTQAARSTAEDIELALDAAHAAFPAWGKTSASARARKTPLIPPALAPATMSASTRSRTPLFAWIAASSSR